MARPSPRLLPVTMATSPFILSTMFLYLAKGSGLVRVTGPPDSSNVLLGDYTPRFPFLSHFRTFETPSSDSSKILAISPMSPLTVAKSPVGEVAARVVRGDFYATADMSAAKWAPFRIGGPKLAKSPVKAMSLSM